MASAEKELEAQLTEAGNQLLEPPSSVDDLLDVLDRVENCLSKVEQSPTKSMQTALSPSQNALVAEELFRHSNPDVKVGVAACISEITRITAPDAPYDDEQMKEVFHLIVSSFENLHDKSSRSYAKRASILETVAKVRSCVVMLDLECDALIAEMFQHFLKAIRDYHPENVFSSMETIMTLVLEESEEVSAELLSPLLASVKNDNEDILPIGRKLGERVLESCATKLKDYLIEEVKSLGISFDDYSKVVASICQEASDDAEQNEGNDAEQNEGNDAEQNEGRNAEQNDIHDADENVAAEKSAIREPSDEAAQVDKEKAEAPVSPERVDPAVDRSSKLVVNNGNAKTGEDDSVAESNALKKEEEGDNTEDQKDPNTSSNAEADSLETEKADDTEQIPEKATKERAGNSDLSTKSTQPSEDCQADNEEDTETQPEHKSETEDVPSSPHEDPSVEAAVQSENEKVSDVNLSSKPLEKEPAGVASPSPSQSLPDESRSKKAGRNKKKDSSNKGAAAFADDEPKKVTDGTSESELKPSRRSGKKASAGVSNENRSPIVVEASRKESGTTSDSEAKLKSAKKVDGSTKTSDGSVKQAEDKKKRGRGKVTPVKAATKSSTKDDDKEMVSTPKSAPKLTKDESPQEETPKTNSKRKRAAGKEKESDDKDHGEDMVGSKIKVWWPKDRTYYEGVVASFDSAKKKHKVSYTDGDVETLNLKKERWEFVADGPDSDEEQGTDQSSHDASSDVPLKKKVKKNPDDSTKKEKLDTSPKSGGGASSSKSKGARTKFGRKLKEGSKADSKSKGGASGKSDDERIGKLKDHTPKSSGKSVEVAQKISSKSKNNDTQTPKSTKSKEDDSSAQKASTKSKQDAQKAGKSNQSTSKTAPVAKGKSSAGGGKANANGTGKAKVASKPAKEDADMKEASSDSEKAPESTPKGKSPTLAKVLASETKSGKKRRRGSKS